MTEKRKIIVIMFIVSATFLFALILLNSEYSATVRGLNDEIADLTNRNNECSADLYNAGTREMACIKQWNTYEEMYYKCVDEKMDMMNVWVDE